jgi:ketosteroid isomerase-like protein
MSDEGDVRAIRELVNDYTDAANRRDPARAAATYAPEGALNARGVDVIGRDAIRQAFERVFGGRDLIFQVTQPGPLEVSGDRAWTRTWIREWTRKAGKATPRVFLGLYQDELIRTAEGWRFARRRLDGLYTADPDFGGEAEPVPSMDHRFEAIGRDPLGGHR